MGHGVPRRARARARWLRHGATPRNPTILGQELDHRSPRRRARSASDLASAERDRHVATSAMASWGRRDDLGGSALRRCCCPPTTPRRRRTWRSLSVRPSSCTGSHHPRIHSMGLLIGSACSRPDASRSRSTLRLGLVSVRIRARIRGGREQRRGDPLRAGTLAWIVWLVSFGAASYGLFQTSFPRFPCVSTAVVDESARWSEDDVPRRAELGDTHAETMAAKVVSVSSSARAVATSIPRCHPATTVKYSEKLRVFICSLKPKDEWMVQMGRQARSDAAFPLLPRPSFFQDALVTPRAGRAAGAARRPPTRCRARRAGGVAPARRVDAAAARSWLREPRSRPVDLGVAMHRTARRVATPRPSSHEVPPALPLTCASTPRATAAAQSAPSPSRA